MNRETTVQRPGVRKSLEDTGRQGLDRNFGCEIFQSVVETDQHVHTILTTCLACDTHHGQADVLQGSSQRFIAEHLLREGWETRLRCGEEFRSQVQCLIKAVADQRQRIVGQAHELRPTGKPIPQHVGTEIEMLTCDVRVGRVRFDNGHRGRRWQVIGHRSSTRAEQRLNTGKRAGPRAVFHGREHGLKIGHKPIYRDDSQCAGQIRRPRDLQQVMRCRDATPLDLQHTRRSLLEVSGNP